MSDLFARADPATEAGAKPAPLADRLRPQQLGDVVGQDHLLADDAPLGRMIARSTISSVILWGPPGTGKTTIARLLAAMGALRFVQISAILSGVADLKKIFEAARHHRQMGQATLLFVDEIHRFNRSQQDSFLPYVEDGTLTLIGATTENPSFEINGALLSRMQVLQLKRLDDVALQALLARAEAHLPQPLQLTPAARDMLIAMADGDGRMLLNQVEVLHDLGGDQPLDGDALTSLLQKRAPSHDKDRDGHYNLASALHKSLRSSDADAALYWLARALDAGENPLFILRRLVRFASEDVGLADPQALRQALAAKEAYQFLGSPEGELAIFEAALYLATAPKSNAAYKASKAALQAARDHGGLMPPAHLMNAPTKMMKDLGYGAGYLYDHDHEDGFSGQNCFPDDLPRQSFYQPPERGFERDIAKRLAYWDRLRSQKKNKE
ncbi:replication-associated recombination protein A [alpha proteobacterium Q-1]|nr:replication-associated recombination protein A [alpha proteobacterium Q-1]